MRIGMIAPLEMRVPPLAYGGTEAVVSLLSEGLVHRGHDVTLFASGDSVTGARLESVCPHFPRETPRHRGALNTLNAAVCLKQAEHFDIIHNHTEFVGMAMAGLVDTPVLTTLHGNLTPDLSLLFSRYDGWYNTVSLSAKSLLPEKDRFAGVIYNSIDIASYPFNDRSTTDSYLLFLSRMSAEKGPRQAIDVARKLGRRLLLAGNVDADDEEYFQTQVLPEVDGELIEYVGEADQRRKRQLLSEAYCLLAPIDWPEPFGLFMVEAMASGTPVIAFNRGSVPEVVVDGETGYVVDTPEQMAAAVQQVDHIDRSRCRQHVVEKFDAPRMVDDYIAVYQRIMSASERELLPRILVGPVGAAELAGQIAPAPRFRAASRR